MTDNILVNELLQIQEKVGQVLRIKSVLDEKKIEALKVLQEARDYQTFLWAVQSLKNIFEREKRVLGICQYGLVRTREVLKKSDEKLAACQPFSHRVLSVTYNKLPGFLRDWSQSSFTFLKGLGSKMPQSLKRLGSKIPQSIKKKLPFRNFYVTDQPIILRFRLVHHMIKVEAKNAEKILFKMRAL